MLFTKSGADNITVINPQGVRSAQCNAKFDVSEQPTQEPMVNVSMVSSRGEEVGVATRRQIVLMNAPLLIPVCVSVCLSSTSCHTHTDSGALG